MELGTVWKGLTALIGIALRSFVLTVAAMIGLGIVLAGVAYYLAVQTEVWRGVLATLAALVICVVLGFVVAGQRAVAMALMRGLREYRLGEGLLRLLFERILGMAGEQPVGERGGRIAQTVERLPLAQAEQRLHDGVTAFLKAPLEGGGLTGWLRRKVQGKVLKLVHDGTLARFREQGAKEGGVDLVKVQSDLAQRIDALLLAKVWGAALRMTALTVVGAVLAAVGVALALQKVGV